MVKQTWSGLLSPIFTRHPGEESQTNQPVLRRRHLQLILCRLCSNLLRVKMAGPNNAGPIFWSSKTEEFGRSACALGVVRYLGRHCSACIKRGVCYKWPPEQYLWTWWLSCRIWLWYWNFMSIKENCPSSRVGKPSGCGRRWHSQVVCAECLSIVKKETVLDRLRLAVGKFVQVALNWSLKNPNSFWNGKY